MVVMLLGQGCGKLPLFFPDAGRPDSGVEPTTDGGTRVDGGISYVDACRNLNLNRCAYFIRCGLVEDTMDGREACVRQLEATWCGPLTWPPHVLAGALRFDPVKAETCGTAFATWSCAEFQALPDSCLTFLRPRAALNEPCFDGYTECTEGVCRGTVCPRTCQARGFSGESCSSDGECRQSLYCRRPQLMPSVGMCTPLGSAGSACEVDAECLIGLECLNQQCRLLPSSGEACLSGRCADSAYCDPLASDAGVCVTRRGEMATCDGDECQSVLVCDVLSQRCLRREVGSGDICSPSQTCPTNETCLGVSANDAGTCGAPLAVGEPCISHRDCQTHLACRADGDAGLACRPRAMAGASCATSRDCFTSATCLQGVCQQRPLPSEPCNDTLACRWGLCRESTSMDGGVCGSLLSAGTPCRTNDQCASNICAAGTCIGRCLP